MGRRAGVQFEGFMNHAPDTHHTVQTQEWLNTFRIEFNNGSSRTMTFSMYLRSGSQRLQHLQERKDSGGRL